MEDTRAVRDKYKGMSNEFIKADIKQNSFPCGVLMSHLKGDLNFGVIIRAANNFGLGEIFYYGQRKIDRRSAIGTYLYSDIKYLSNLDEIKKLKERYVFIGLENNIEDARPIKEFEWPKNSLIILGQEGVGIEDDLMILLDCMVEIPSLGSCRSLNVASAASIAIYDYITKY